VYGGEGHCQKGHQGVFERRATVNLEGSGRSQGGVEKTKAKEKKKKGPQKIKKKGARKAKKLHLLLEEHEENGKERILSKGKEK